MGEKHTLTGDDIALAAFACAHAINWCKSQGRSKYWKGEAAKYTDLSRKLQHIGDVAYPIRRGVEGGMLDIGSEEIMRLDTKIVNATARQLRKEAA